MVQCALGGGTSLITNMSLLNKSKVKNFTLDIAQRYRPFVGFKRVSAEFYDRLDVKLRAIIVHEVTTAPSKGVTIK